MEWIETTGKSIEEAKEAALDELGVDEQDAEFEVLAEPKAGLFGRMRGEARVRSRVRPTAPRPKDDRRNRRRNRAGGAAGETASAPGAVATTAVSAEASGSDAPAAAPAGGDPVGEAIAEAAAAVTESPADKGRPAGSGRRNGSASAGTGRGSRRATEERNEERDKMSNVDVPLEEQGKVAREFLLGLVQEFGVAAEVTATVGDEDVIDVAVTGTDLGMLIGPKGTTLLALQDLTRSAVQQKTSAGNGRINVDVAGYRRKRSEALARFALQIAENVKATGVRQALEPMSAVDRKVVHDTLTDVDGVSTISEGEDARRHVVVVPAED
ncbi:Jag N-terminal domain-containing protein [Acidiferrimicrobium sp. IK]|uniref:RNA-binding cell elongation regulator Jag/EloR n=1 Tax=Acidiferrimicrobium sp. IK TaxID=2871700 RepID=UPI0021CB45F6|nr:RNA-binding cell elongation regulator Jag/EloR [Acidiferrimicrobium sp. IK]MCU4186130.1 Jag N-terminal domain-containing protein [Acidiferrimicrobium sp. IK]